MAAPGHPQIPPLFLFFVTLILSLLMAGLCSAAPTIFASSAPRPQRWALGFDTTAGTKDTFTLTVFSQRAAAIAPDAPLADDLMQLLRVPWVELRRVAASRSIATVTVLAPPSCLLGTSALHRGFAARLRSVGLPRTAGRLSSPGAPAEAVVTAATVIRGSDTPEVLRTEPCGPVVSVRLDLRAPWAAALFDDGAASADARVLQQLDFAAAVAADFKAAAAPQRVWDNKSYVMITAVPRPHAPAPHAPISVLPVVLRARAAVGLSPAAAVSRLGAALGRIASPTSRGLTAFRATQALAPDSRSASVVLLPSSRASPADAAGNGSSVPAPDVRTCGTACVAIIGVCAGVALGVLAGLSAMMCLWRDAPPPPKPSETSGAPALTHLEHAHNPLVGTA